MNYFTFFLFLISFHLIGLSKVSSDSLQIRSYSISYNYFSIPIQKHTLQLNENTTIGLCWSTQSNPTIRDAFTTDTSTLNNISLIAKELTPNTNYFFRLFVLTENGTIYGEIKQLTTAISPENLIIGDVYQGGIIAHIFKEGEEGYVENEIHGFVVTEEDVASSQWGCYSVHTGTKTKNELGYGKQNTQKILNFHRYDLQDYPNYPDQCHTSNDGSIAAYICDTLNWNEYNDWILPSLHEMHAVRYNLHEKGMGNLQINPIFYWTSSEEKEPVWIFRRGKIYAFTAQMETAIYGLGREKNLTGQIRAIRYF